MVYSEPMSREWTGATTAIVQDKIGEKKSQTERSNGSRPSVAQKKFLVRGLEQPGGKLPLFDEFGQEIDSRTVRACIRAGWAVPWFINPTKPDWLVCKLSAEGRAVLNRVG